MWGRLVVLLAVVGVGVAAVVGYRMVTAEPEPDDEPSAQVVELTGGQQALKGTEGKGCPPATRLDAREASTALAESYADTYGRDGGADEGSGSDDEAGDLPFQGAGIAQRADLEDRPRSYVVLALTLAGDDVVRRVGCFDGVQVVWDDGGPFEAK